MVKAPDYLLISCYAINKRDHARQHLDFQFHDQERNIGDVDLDEASLVVFVC